MIRIILTCLLVFSSAQASYLNLYQDSRADLKNLEQEVILGRIFAEGFDTLSADGVLSEEQKAAFIEKEKLTDQNSSIQAFFSADAYIKQRYNEEQSILSFERSLLRALSQKPIFSDENTENGPFDLVHDLNLVDQILFGEKAETIKPSFAVTGSALALEAADWQVGDPRTDGQGDGIVPSSGATPKSEFTDKDKNITAALEDIMDYLIELNQKPLNLETAIAQNFGLGQSVASVARQINLITQRSSSPGAPKETTPEVRVTPTLGFKELALSLLNRFVIADNYDYYSGLDTQVSASRSTEIQKTAQQVLLEESLTGIGRSTEIFGQEAQSYRQDRKLSHLFKHLESVFLQTELLKESLETIADKPDR